MDIMKIWQMKTLAHLRYKKNTTGQIRKTHKSGRLTELVNNLPGGSELVYKNKEPG